MSEYLIQSSTLDNIAKPIQTLTGSTNKISLEQMKTGVENANNEISIQAEKIAGILDMLDGKTAPTVPTVEQATPSISVSSSGLITATSTQTEGYVEGGMTSATKQLTTQATKTWTPTTKDQTIPSGTYLTGTQTIEGDSNLKAANIKSGVSIFGVNGNMQASIGDMSALYDFSMAKSGIFSISQTCYSEYTFTHGLGQLPKLILIYSENATTTNASSNGTARIGYFAIRTCNETEFSSSTTSGGVYLQAFWGGGATNIMDRSGAWGATASMPTDGVYPTFAVDETAYMSVIKCNSNTITWCADDYFALGAGTYKWLVMA